MYSSNLFVSLDLYRKPEAQILVVEPHGCPRDQLSSLEDAVVALDKANSQK